MAIIVTYDVTGKHTELKNNMKEKGYKDQIKGNKCDIIYFPNTTLYHGSKSPEEARIDLQVECKRLSIELERCVATPWGPNWSVICGDPFD